MIVLAVLALAATACGGSNDTDSSSDTTASLGVVDVDQVAAAADTIEAQWGAVDGFAVMMIAVDNGYTSAQIIENPALGANGTIESVEPANEAAGLITVEPAEADGSDEQSMGADIQLVSLRRDSAPAGSPAESYVSFIDATLGEIYDAGQAQISQLDEEEAFEEQVAYLSLILLNRGYSQEQIIESMVLGTIDFGFLPQLTGCFEIVDQVPVSEDGMPHCPRLKKNTDPAPDDASSEPTTETADQSEVELGEGSYEDGTYAGPVDFDELYRLAAPALADAITVSDNRFEVVIADGALVSLAGGARLANPVVPMEDGEICAGDDTLSYAADPSSGKMSGSTLSIDVTVSQVGTSTCSDGEVDSNSESSVLQATIVFAETTATATLVASEDGVTQSLTALLTLE